MTAQRIWRLRPESARKKRVGVACAVCRVKKRRCDGNRAGCQPCIEANQPCSFAPVNTNKKEPTRQEALMYRDMTDRLGPALKKVIRAALVGESLDHLRECLAGMNSSNDDETSSRDLEEVDINMALEILCPPERDSEQPEGDDQYEDEDDQELGDHASSDAGSGCEPADALRYSDPKRHTQTLQPSAFRFPPESIDEDEEVDGSESEYAPSPKRQIAPDLSARLLQAPSARMSIASSVTPPPPPPSSLSSCLAPNGLLPGGATDSLQIHGGPRDVWSIRTR